MLEAQTETTEDAASDESTVPFRAKLLLAQARTVFDCAVNREEWDQGRHYLQAAVREGSSDACQSMAYCHLTGENGFEIDPAAALEYMNAWRRQVLKEIRDKPDKQQLDKLESACEKFAALWRRCSTEITADTALSLLGHTLVGYRIYRRFPGAQGPKTILVLELDDGSEVEIINYFGTIHPTGACAAGGRGEVGARMHDHWSSRLSTTCGWEGGSADATALYNNFEYEIFKQWSGRDEIG